MAVPKETHWPIEPHTAVKHLILRRYLDAWLPIMATCNGRIVFIDGFAGPGRYKGGEEGSPLIALRALLDHHHFRKPRANREVVFRFIEREPKRAVALKEEIGRFLTERGNPKWVNFGVEQGEFAALMSAWLDRLEEAGKTLAPTFVFIDPFGFAGVPMSLISRIAQNPKCECLITFMYQAINRFLITPQATVQAHFDELFGTDEWRAMFEVADPASRREQLVALYQRQLVERAGFQCVRSFEMIDRGNQTEYFLYFATKDPTGLSKMKQAMWREDPAGGQLFSDRTVTNQIILIQPTVDLSLLRNLLQQRFRGPGWVGVEDVEKFVLEGTPFSETIHLKRRTLKPMEQSEPPQIRVRRPAGSRERPGEYPRGTEIKFL